MLTNSNKWVGLKVDLSTGDPETMDPWGPAVNQQFVQLYTLFSTRAFCSVVLSTAYLC